MIQKEKRLRSERHRRIVASLDCSCCGRSGPSQAAHANFSTGMGLKACDSLTFPLCPECHRHHDQGGMRRQDRWQREWEYADATRAELISKNLWSPEVEDAYQKAIQPLAAVIHLRPI